MSYSVIIFMKYFPAASQNLDDLQNQEVLAKSSVFFGKASEQYRKSNFVVASLDDEKYSG